MADISLTTEEEFSFIDDGPVGPASLPDLVLASPVTQSAPLNSTATNQPAQASEAQSSGGGGMLGGGNVLAILGNWAGAVGGSMGRLDQVGSLERAAKNLYTEAAQTMRQGEYVAMTRGLDLEQRLGSLKTAVAASGVDSSSGSIQAARNMTETFGRLDVQMERLNAARRAKGLRAQAKQYEAQAEDIWKNEPFNLAADFIG